MKTAHLLLALALAATLSACTSVRGPVSARELEANQATSLQYAHNLYDLIGAPANSYLYKVGVPSSLEDVYTAYTDRSNQNSWAVVARYSYGGALYVENIRADETKWIRLGIIRTLKANGWKWVRGERGPDGKSSMMYRTLGMTRTTEPAVALIYVMHSTKDPSRVFVYLAVGPEDHKEQLKYDTSKVIGITSVF